MVSGGFKDQHAWARAQAVQPIYFFIFKKDTKHTTLFLHQFTFFLRSQKAFFSFLLSLAGLNHSLPRRRRSISLSPTPLNLSAAVKSAAHHHSHSFSRFANLI
jgi:hypothetical protein